MIFEEVFARKNAHDGVQDIGTRLKLDLMWSKIDMLAESRNDLATFVHTRWLLVAGRSTSVCDECGCWIDFDRATSHNGRTPRKWNRQFQLTPQFGDHPQSGVRGACDSVGTNVERCL